MSITLKPGPPGSRGCGKPKSNGVYLKGRTSPDGVPIQDYMVCPPHPIDLTLPTRGVMIIERNGTYHAIKRIGLEHYPSCFGWAVECIRKGPSIHINPKTDLSKLTEDSRLIVVHPRAIIENAREYRTKMAEEWEKLTHCHIDLHHNDSEGEVAKKDTCMRHWQIDMHMDGNTAPKEAELQTGHHWYYQGDIGFYANPRHPDIKPKYQQGIIGSFPISIHVEKGARAASIAKSIATGVDVTHG